MKLTNKYALPQAFVDAVSNDDYDRGESDATVTELIGPPRVSILRRKHDAEIEEDVISRFWSLFGQIAHGILERANTVDLAEKRHYYECLGWKVGGKFDTLELSSGILSDWKITSVWKMLGIDHVPIEFEQQLNLLRLILVENGHEVNQLRVVAGLRDWSKPEARRSKEYPREQVVIRPVNLWDLSVTRAFLEERVAIHQAARKASEEGRELPLCTPEERWLRPSRYAVLKPGNKRATKVFDTITEAQALAKEKGMIVETREGENTRCILYCSAAKFCDFGKPLLYESEMEGIL